MVYQVPDLPVVTVYVTTHNYGRFLREAVDSILKQSLKAWELIIMDDGSSDDSYDIAQEYAENYPDQIRVVRTNEARGLRACANEALGMARGKYFMRLDADDYLDENALLVLSAFLDGHADCALVYPNWTYVTEEGITMGTEWRKRPGEETEMLDLPAHGACTMVRKKVLKALGGYDTTHNSQDGHELWLKMIGSHQVGHVETPLFFYRQHGTSMSRNETRLLNSRRKIKRDIREKFSGEVGLRALAVIPAQRNSDYMENVPLVEVGGRSLLDRAIESAVGCPLVQDVIVTVDHPEIGAKAGEHGESVEVFERPKHLEGRRVPLAAIVHDAVSRFEEEAQVFPDVVVVLDIMSPLRKAEHIAEAIDTLVLCKTDVVVSTLEDRDLHLVHTRDGLRPLNPGMLNQLRYEREAIYVPNGAVVAIWREMMNDESFYVGRVGHTVMAMNESFQVRTPEDLAFLENANLVLQP